MGSRAIALCLAAFHLFGFGTLAQAHTASFIVLGAVTDPPRGYTEMCEADPALCRAFTPAAAAEPAAVALAPAAPFPAPPSLDLPQWQATALWSGLAAAAHGRACPPTDRLCMGPFFAAPGDDLAAALPVKATATVAVAAPIAACLPVLARDMPDGLIAGAGCASVGASVRPVSLALEFASSLPVTAAASPAFPAIARRTGAAIETAAIQPALALVKAALAPASESASVSAGGPAITAHDRDALRLLKRINSHVNGRVHQASDLEIYGQPEVWRPSGDGPRAVGDCEDLALEKRMELLAVQFPANRLFLAVVYRSGVGLHTVLVARLADGDVVLDSRVNYIESWSRTGYSWLSIEAPGRPQEWHEAA